MSDDARSWFEQADLDVVESAGRRLYAATIRRRDHRTSKLFEQKVRLRVPTAVVRRGCKMAGITTY